MKTAEAPRSWERECSMFCRAALKRAPAKLIGDLFAEAMQFVSSFAERRPTPRYLMMLQLASELVEVANLLSDVYQVLLVLKLLLGDVHVREEIAQVCMSLLQEMLPKLKGLKKHEETLLLDLVPLLQQIGNGDEALFPQCAELVEKIKSVCAAMELPQEPVSLLEEDFDRILADLADPLLPVRAHALIGLRKLVLARDATTMAQFERVVAIFKSQMQSEDSYLYLGAVQGLIALGDVAAAETIPLLVKDFHNAKLSTETRLKIGEATVSIAQRCGEMLPVHAPVLMDCFLRGVQDGGGSADVRASSLANIGTMCEILNWALHPYVHEIIHAVLSVLQLERDELVRRAAVLVLGRRRAPWRRGCICYAAPTRTTWSGSTRSGRWTS